jgi:hypothetical protein
MTATKYWYILHGVTSHMTFIFMLTAVKTSCLLHMTYDVVSIKSLKYFRWVNLQTRRRSVLSVVQLISLVIFLFFPLRVISINWQPLLYNHAVICRWIIRLSITAVTQFLPSLHNPLNCSLGDKIFQHAQRSSHPRIWCNFRLLSSRFHARIFLLFLRSLREMRRQNITGLQWLHNCHCRLSVIPRLLNATNEKIHWKPKNSLKYKSIFTSRSSVYECHLSDTESNYVLCSWFTYTLSHSIINPFHLVLEVDWEWATW